MDIFKILNNEGKLTKVLIYPAVETIADPYEKNTVKGFLNPTTIKALVTPIGMSALRWKYYGTLPIGSVQVIIEPKYKNLLLLADKIKINNEYYHCHQDDSRNFQYIDRGYYVMAILVSKND